MRDGVSYNYRTRLIDDSTSVYNQNKKVYTVNDCSLINDPLSSNKYVNIVSQNFNIFRHVLSEIKTIQNQVLKERLIYFVSIFMHILSQYNGVPNVLPSLTITEDEDSVFLEWVFKDFRMGFTFCENEKESMWFLVSNRNLEELSVSGDLMKSDYYSIITKVIIFVLGNT